MKLVPVIEPDAMALLKVALGGRLAEEIFCQDVSSGAASDIAHVTEIARKRIKENLESVDGVGAVILVGGRQRAINVYIDTDKLTSYNLSIEEVSSFTRIRRWTSTT